MAGSSSVVDPSNLEDHSGASIMAVDIMDRQVEEGLVAEWAVEVSLNSPGA